jgi:hypothetical protein
MADLNGLRGGRGRRYTDLEALVLEKSYVPDT